ncbi:hypothetical protein NQ318_003067 [Aromia moschata]|uniref:Uncharacterized protein n=1 Tax=Aromia moschata TaxID=1265417 RepID=A0AAV8Y3X3_9CUCU|nr:hypothetical protein NQ318_003067 [Aromia moschata]
MQRSLEQRMANKFCVKLEKSAAEAIPMLKKYNGEYFQQHEGTAMGNSLSPFIANLFMSKFETEVRVKFEYFPRAWIRPQIRDMRLLHLLNVNLVITKKILDADRLHGTLTDIFAVFDTKAISLNNFVAKLNNCFPTIKFTYEMEHNEQLPFLDVLVIRNSENKFHTTLFNIKWQVLIF